MTTLRLSFRAAFAALGLSMMSLTPVVAQEPAVVASFAHRFHHPEQPSGETIILLHGSGGNESSLMALAEKAAPGALLIGVGGRIVQDGTKRWYRRVTATSFDQADIRKEAAAFAVFLKGLSETYKLDPDRTTLLGYSNGANMIAAMALLHPGSVHRAILMRPMPVLDAIPKVSLSKTNFLTIAGITDKIYAPFAPALARILASSGAKVEAETIEADHMLGPKDVALVSDWLAETQTADASVR